MQKVYWPFSYIFPAEKLCCTQQVGNGSDTKFIILKILDKKNWTFIESTRSAFFSSRDQKNTSNKSCSLLPLHTVRSVGIHQPPDVNVLVTSSSSF